MHLPLFPLRNVLFPGGYLPLRIFEVRYLDMIGRSHKAGTPFGVVCLTHGAEVNSAPVAGRPSGDGYANEEFHLEGTLAQINRLERPNPGLMMIRCTGAQRFRVCSSEKLKHGLWMAEVELLPDDVAVPVPADLENSAFALQVQALYVLSLFSLKYCLYLWRSPRALLVLRAPIALRLKSGCSMRRWRRQRSPSVTMMPLPSRILMRSKPKPLM